MPILRIPLSETGKQTPQNILNFLFIEEMAPKVRLLMEVGPVNDSRPQGTHVFLHDSPFYVVPICGLLIGGPFLSLNHKHCHKNQFDDSYS